MPGAAVGAQRARDATRHPATVASRRAEPGDLALHNGHSQIRLVAPEVVRGPQAREPAANDCHVAVEPAGQPRSLAQPPWHPVQPKAALPPLRSGGIIAGRPSQVRLGVPIDGITLRTCRMPIWVHGSLRLGRCAEALNIVHANPYGNDTAIFTNDIGAARGVHPRGRGRHGRGVRRLDPGTRRMEQWDDTRSTIPGRDVNGPRLTNPFRLEETEIRDRGVIYPGASG